MAPLVLIYLKIQRMYRGPARDLRRINSQSRSPIYALFSEVLEGTGLPTIRNFRAESYFSGRNKVQVEENQSAGFSELTLGQWLALRLQLMAASVVFSVGMAAVVGKQLSETLNPQPHGPGPSYASPGGIGLSLSYSLPIVSLLNGLLTSLSETEKEMVAVERILQFSSLPPQDDSGQLQPLEVDHGAWPKEGKISFQNVFLQYRLGLQFALDGVSFVLPGGSKVLSFFFYLVS